ncbi:hypothetical protein IQ273_30960 [Nodosilinea sp. LEGE 07298]|uniref:hypothetical protein n=1 Tax=Nodosilinea sp. LEGE 07298 TaxID=2777970 RepID=UPI001880E7E7|nr:hypothetical protein [Nodosilinea sp. LEGE 07298]MBE9113794.1 hypothetical protein [Nodosilinea sp. LEGE 07298]
MPRRINPQCLHCAQLSVEQARQLHGEQGDGCWEESRCHRRRSHYRNRRDNNASRRSTYRQSAQENQAGQGPETISVAIALKPVAYLYLYRQKRQDAPLHALSVSVWEGEQHLLDVTPIHCAGMRNQKIQEYLVDVLKTLRERYGITKFEPEIRLEPTECPIKSCPLKPHLVAEESQ